MLLLVTTLKAVSAHMDLLPHDQVPVINFTDDAPKASNDVLKQTGEARYSVSCEKYEPPGCGPGMGKDDNAAPVQSSDSYT